MAVSLAVLDFFDSKRKIRVRKNNQPDPIQLNHEQKKQRIRKFYKMGKIESLRRAMQRVLDEIMWYDPDLEAYVMEKTGYAIDTRVDVKEQVLRYHRDHPSPPLYFKDLFEVLSPEGCYWVKVFESGLDEDWADTSIHVSFKQNGLSTGGAGFCTIYGTDIDLEFIWESSHVLQIIHPSDAIFNSQWIDTQFHEHTLQIIYTAR